MNITDNDCSRILSNLAPVLTQKDITKQYKVDVVRKTSKQRMRQQLIDRRTNNRSSRKQHPETDRRVREMKSSPAIQASGDDDDDKCLQNNYCAQAGNFGELRVPGC